MPPPVRSIMGQVAAHYRQRANCFEFAIAEWGEHGEPVTLYASPLTLEERNKVQAAMRERGDFAGYAQIAVMKLVHADGSKAFDLADKFKIMKAGDARIFQTIGDRLLYDLPEVETAEKNGLSPDFPDLSGRGSAGDAPEPSGSGADDA